MNHTDTDELREKLDKIFTKATVKDFDKDGNPVYEYRQPFLIQLNEALYLITAYTTNREREARIDELERVVVESDSNKMTIYAMQRRTELSEELSNE